MTAKKDSKAPQAQKNAVGNRDCYERGLELAEAGKYEEALACIQEHLDSTPDDAGILNDAATILHCLGRSDEAIEHLTKARSLKGDSAEIIWNLSEVYLAAGKAEQASELFDEMERMGILNADVLNRTADVFMNENNPEDALKLLERSLEMSPEQEILESMIEVIRHKMTESNCE